VVNVNQARIEGYYSSVVRSRPEQGDRAGTLLGMLTLFGACVVTFMVPMYALERFGPASGILYAMNPAELRDHCLSFARAEETFPFGSRTSVFKVAGKIFALSQLGADSLRVSLKCEPALAEALREMHTAVIPGYHLNKRHWNTVILDGSLPDETVRDMIEDSYDIVVSKLPQADRRALGWRGDSRAP
jgi:predicted DNA-binding protein (MmcQ/YjbR family)